MLIFKGLVIILLLLERPMADGGLELFFDEVGVLLSLRAPSHRKTFVISSVQLLGIEVRISFFFSGERTWTLFYVMMVTFGDFITAPSKLLIKGYSYRLSTC